MRVLIAAAVNTLRFWNQLLEHLPSEFQTQIIPLWKSGFPTFREVVFPLELHRTVRDFSPDMLISDLPVPQAFLVDFSKLLRRKHLNLCYYLRGDLWTEVRTDPRFAVRAASVSIIERQLQKARFFLTICKWLATRVTTEIGEGARTSVVYQGIDPTKFYKDKSRALSHPNVGILQTHNILPKAAALANFSGVIARMPEVHFYVVEGADVPEIGRATYFPIVKHALSRLPNVHFVKQLAYPHEVREFLSSCDVYALVSGLDCCPTTLLEASLTETPVIASRVGGVPELILEGRTGFCLENSSLDDWVGTIRELHKDQDRAAEIGKAARVFVAKEFNWEKISLDFAAALRTEGPGYQRN